MMQNNKYPILIGFVWIASLAGGSVSCVAQEEGQIPKLDATETEVAPKPLLKFSDRIKAQKIARKFQITIPNPRGDIFAEYYDAQGVKKQTLIATSQIGYYFQIDFTPIIKESDPAVVFSYIQDRVAYINKTFGRSDKISELEGQNYFENRRWIEMRVGSMLSIAEVKKANGRKLMNGVELLEVPMRYYPKGKLAAHLIGAVKRVNNWASGPIKNGEELFPQYAGIRGLEKSEDAQLAGESMVLEYEFNEEGVLAKRPLKTIRPGRGGQGIVISLDTEMQKITEDILRRKTAESGTGKGAMVVLDSESMEIKALASWPAFDPNDYIPVLTSAKEAEYREAQEKNLNPLISRAFQAAYPPASVFKIATAFIALGSDLVRPEEKKYHCFDSVTYHRSETEPGITMKNWTKEPGEPKMTVSEALKRSCNTWFFQAANDLQSQSKFFEKWFHGLIPMLGLGKKTGLGFAEESSGNMYVKDGVKQKFFEGAHVANISIGQGDLLTTPLQLAQMVARVANSGQDTKAFVIRGKQDKDQKWISVAQPVDENVNLKRYERSLDEVRLGMWDVVHGPRGTGKGAQANTFDVVGKTGSAQWSNKRNVAWFASYAPYYNGTRDYSHKPKFIVVAMQEGNQPRYEGDKKHELAGGNHGAPLVGAFFASKYVNDRMAEHMGIPSLNRGVLRALPVLPGEE